MSAAETPRVSRGLLIALGAVIGLAALVALWFFVAAPLLEPEPLAAPAPAEAAVDEGTDLEPEATPDPEATPVPETFETFSARDPFQQLVTPVVATDPGAPAADAGGGDADGDDSDPDSGSDDPAPGVRVGQTSVRLIDVFTDDQAVERVRVDVNGTEHTPAEDEQFAERFRVLDITGSCATFLFGDNRFTLCEGETIRK